MVLVVEVACSDVGLGRTRVSRKYGRRWAGARAAVSVSAVFVARREHENEAGVMCARCEAFARCACLRVGVILCVVSVLCV